MARGPDVLDEPRSSGGSGSWGPCHQLPHDSGTPSRRLATASGGWVLPPGLRLFRPTRQPEGAGAKPRSSEVRLALAGNCARTTAIREQRPMAHHMRDRALTRVEGLAAHRRRPGVARTSGVTAPATTK